MAASWTGFYRVSARTNQSCVQLYFIDVVFGRVNINMVCSLSAGRKERVQKRLLKYVMKSYLLLSCYCQQFVSSVQTSNQTFDRRRRRRRYVFLRSICKIGIGSTTQII